MTTRRALGLGSAVMLGAGLLLQSSAARADVTDPYRYGLVLSTGAGAAGVAKSGPLPGGVVFTDLGGELLGEVLPWGGFLRADYLSTGNGSRWTAWQFSGGLSRRLFGDVDHTALFLRGGALYERWSGNNNACDVVPFVPSSCNTLGTTQATFNVSADMLGLVGGARLELPLRSVYVAFDLDLVPAVALDGSNPAATFEAILAVNLGFRDTREDADKDIPRTNTHRGRAIPTTGTEGN